MKSAKKITTKLWTTISRRREYDLMTYVLHPSRESQKILPKLLAETFEKKIKFSSLVLEHCESRVCLLKDLALSWFKEQL